MKPAARGLRRDAAGHRFQEPDGSFRLTQPQSVEQRPANPPVYDQAISAFKSRDGATGSWSDCSVDYTVVVTKLAKAPLHCGNGRTGIAIAIARAIVRVAVGIAA